MTPRPQRTVIPPLVPIDPGTCMLELRRCATYLKSQLEGRVDERVFDRVLASEDLLYARFAHIGCAGLLTERGAQRIWWLSTPMSLDTYVWAYYRGFALDASNVLVITAVRNLDATVRVLMAGLRGSIIYREIEPALSRLPFALHLGWDPCWYLLNALRGVDAGGAFAFELNPREPVLHRWPANGTDNTLRSPTAR